MKTRRICGKKFKERTRTQVTCSEECRKINTRNLMKRWRENNPERCKELQKAGKEYYYKPSGTCKICGKIVEQEIMMNGRSRKQFHDECVFEKASQILRSGNRLSHGMISNLARRGYTVTEFREEYMKNERKA